MSTHLQDVHSLNRVIKHREMIWILLFFSLISFVCTFVVRNFPAVYDAEENDNITIVWDSHVQTDMFLINMVCFSDSALPKILYKMTRGAEDSESQHEQFAGRVQCERDALRGGRISLHLSGVTAEDSGNYRCDLAANYNKDLRRWEVETSEYFTLNVTQRSHLKNGNVFLTTTEGAERPKEEHKPQDWNGFKTVFGAINIGVFLYLSLIFLLEEAVRRVPVLYERIKTMI